MAMNIERVLLARANDFLVEFLRTIDNSMDGDHPAREELEVLLQDIERQRTQTPATPTAFV